MLQSHQVSLVECLFAGQWSNPGWHMKISSCWYPLPQWGDSKPHHYPADAGLFRSNVEIESYPPEAKTEAFHILFHGLASQCDSDLTEVTHATCHSKLNQQKETTWSKYRWYAIDLTKEVKLWNHSQHWLTTKRFTAEPQQPVAAMWWHDWPQARWGKQRKHLSRSETWTMSFWR